MIRGLLYIIVAIFVITIVRAVAGFIGKAVAQLFEPNGEQFASRQPKRPRGGAELVQCPSCGIYVSTETKLRKTIDGETRYFCSEGCLNRYQG